MNENNDNDDRNNTNNSSSNNHIITVSEGNTGEYRPTSKYCPSLRGQYLTEVNIRRYCPK